MLPDPSAYFRNAFPLFATAGLACAFILQGRPTFSVSPGDAATHAAPASTPLTAIPASAIEKKLTPPRYEVKFHSVNLTGMDYDLGNALVEVTCLFTDLSPDRPVIGMSEVGMVTSLQTENGALYENTTGFSPMQPAIKEFKAVPFLLRSKIPLQTRRLTMVNGALTVQRCYERPTLAWREPFAPEVGRSRKINGFEFTLSRYELKDDTATVEISMRVPSGDAAEDVWTRRQLKTVLMGADKVPILPEASKDSVAKIYRTFRLNKKFVVALELSFASDLRTENLPFVLTDISLDGNKEKRELDRSGQNF